MSAELPKLAAQPALLKQFFAAFSFGLFWVLAFPLALLLARVRSGNRRNPLFFVAAAGLVTQALGGLPNGSPYGYMLVNSAAVVVFTATVAALLWRPSHTRPLAACLVLSASIGLTAWTCDWLVPGLPRRYNALTRAPYLDVLEAAPYPPRIYGFDSVLFPNFAAPFGLSNVTNLENLVPQRTASFFAAYSTRERIPLGSTVWRPGERPARDQHTSNSGLTSVTGISSASDTCSPGRPRCIAGSYSTHISKERMPYHFSCPLLRQNP